LGASALAFLAERKGVSRNVQFLLWGIITVSLAVFAGLRADDVGADTNAYVNRFNYLVSINQVWDVSGSGELGSKILLAASRLLSDNPSVYLLITSSLATVLYVTALHRMTRYPATALFVFIAFGFYVFHMNGLRQGLALGFYMHALAALLVGRPMSYVIWTLVAAMFHISALALLPVYFLVRMGLSIWSLSLLALILWVGVSAISSILPYFGILNERYIDYGERTETGATLLTLFYVTAAVSFLLSRSLIRPEWRDRFDYFLILILFGAIIYVVVTLTGSYVEMTRMALYLNVSITVLCSIVLHSLPNRLRVLAMLGFIAVGTGFYFMFLGQIGGYVPYVLR
jgi:hypothetical protein